MTEITEWSTLNIWDSSLYKLKELTTYMLNLIGDVGLMPISNRQLCWDESTGHLFDIDVDKTYVSLSEIYDKLGIFLLPNERQYYNNRGWIID